MDRNIFQTSFIDNPDEIVKQESKSIPTSDNLLQTCHIDNNKEITTKDQQPKPIAEKLSKLSFVEFRQS